jgi:hypothetical protein
MGRSLTIFLGRFILNMERVVIAGKTVSVFIILVLLTGQNLQTWAGSQQENEEEKLADILRKAGQYCARLEKASLDIVCLEQITEKIDYSRDRSDGIYLMPGGIRTQIRVAKLLSLRLSIHPQRVQQKRKKSPPGEKWKEG